MPDLASKALNTRELWDSIVETKDLHSEDGEAVLELIGTISDKVLATSWARVFESCALELSMIEDIAGRLPNGSPA